MKVVFRQDDSLWYYSQLFRVPYQLIVSTNNFITENLVGSEITIPGYYLDKYYLKEGETLQSVCSANQIPLDAIYLVNGVSNKEATYDMEKINLPRKITTSSITCKKEYDYKALSADIKLLQELYPFIKVETIGYSLLGQEIPHIKVGEGARIIHFNGSFHANEWITTAIIMQFLNDYLLALTNRKTILGVDLLPLFNQFTLSIVPMVNPDGVDLVLHGPPKIQPYRSFVKELNQNRADYKDWKANIRGVDLNNQYPAKWEMEQVRKPKEHAPRDFPGYKPLTEPEAIAMAELAKKYDFELVIAFHTQGKEIYWDFLGFEPMEAEQIVKEFEKLSSYKPIKHLDSYAGYKDWFIYKWGRLGFTVELGEGVNPLPLSQFDEIYKDSLGIFLASQYMLLE